MVRVVASGNCLYSVNQGNRRKALITFKNSPSLVRSDYMEMYKPRIPFER